MFAAPPENSISLKYTLFPVFPYCVPVAPGEIDGASEVQFHLGLLDVLNECFLCDDFEGFEYECAAV